MRPGGGSDPCQLFMNSSTSAMAAWVPWSDGYTESMVMMSEEASLASMVKVWKLAVVLERQVLA